MAATVSRIAVQPGSSIDPETGAYGRNRLPLALTTPANPTPQGEARAQAGLPAHGHHAAQSDQGVGRVQVHVKSKGQAIGRYNGNAQSHESFELDCNS